MKTKLLKDYQIKLARMWGRTPTLSEVEGEILCSIRKVVVQLAPIFRFGYHSVEDMEQEGVGFALEVLSQEGKYDVGRPLENFLYIHVRNRMSNMRRDHYLRLEAPCDCCDPFKPGVEPCAKWRKWKERNDAKQNLMRPSNIGDVGEPPARVEDVEGELSGFLDDMLPVELRADYLRMREEVPIPKARRQRVREAVAEILEDLGYAI